jgi:hypothetical protein
MERSPAPAGWRLRPAAGLRQLDGGQLLVGGSPLRLLRLSTSGARLVRGWWSGRPLGEQRAERLLARRLLDAGLADPDPPPDTRSPGKLTVIVPVHERADQLRTCLAALGGEWRTIVVDDGSKNAEAIAAAARERGACYVRHEHRRGAAATRNTGLSRADTPLVAFLDSDCVPARGFPADLLPHFGDPLVAAVAPRIVALPGPRSRMDSYERAR